ncbi:MAG: CPBP family intramembrane metalloprotease [Candidatus Obscuribacterales bacterium]|nr:CPBP family intramembrane metalloprotease [Candidatus Obscuribacterales bacterium]
MPTFSSSSSLLLLVLLLLSFLPFCRGDKQRQSYVLRALLVACTLSSVLFISQMLKGQSRPAKMRSMVAAERAETTLRFMSIVNVGIAKAYEILTPISDSSGKAHKPIDLSNSGLNSYFRSADKSLDLAIKSSPDDALLKAKRIILLSTWGRQKTLVKTLCKELQESKENKAAELGSTLSLIYLEPAALSKEALESESKVIEAGLSSGWYKENALTALYKTSRQFKDYHAYQQSLEDRYFQIFRMVLAMAVFVCFCAFIGLVVIVIQLGTLSRHDSAKVPEDDRLILDLSPLTVYSVFAAWITCQLGIGEVFKLLPKNLLSLGGNPLGMASFSLVSYLISMIPALLLIHFLAFKPRGLNFFKALRLRLRTPTLGPFKLIVSGFLTWCAIIPLVFVGAFVASTYLGSQGSDNPVLPQIAAIAGSKNAAAIFILLFTVAGLAPLCEEIIFRGFLYSAMRTRFGIFPAILISAFVFAGIHFDKGGSLMLFMLGPALALAFDRTRSLLPSMLAHGLWNGGAFLVNVAIYCS